MTLTRILVAASVLLYLGLTIGSWLPKVGF